MKNTYLKWSGVYRQFGEGTMKSAIVLAMFGVVLSGALLAQTAPATNTDGKEIGGYEVQQSVELGYRFTEISGSDQMYDTLLDQHTGPRLLGQSLTMRAPEKTGLLFDDLSISSFGWGGDPENVARARVSKFKAYDLTFLFRRDHNYFDYNLLANPLNSPTSSFYLPVNFSPHSMYNTRRMYDFDLTILPQSKVSFRVGVSHNRSNGPTLASYHEGVDVLLFQGWNVTESTYRFGIDAKVLPRTTISFDEFLGYGKNDTDASLAPFATYLLPNGTPVELGLPWNPAANSPCATPFRNGAVNPSCSGYYSYTRNQRVRTTTPTEQLRVVSNYWRRLNLVAQGTYSNADLSSPYLELFNGLVSRTQERQFTFTGPVKTRRVNATADLGATVEITKSLRLSDSFRYDNWHMPGTWDSVATSTVGVAPVNLLSALGATTTDSIFNATFLGMRTVHNLVQVEYNPSRLWGARVGYRVRERRIFKAEPEAIDTTDPDSVFEPFEGDTIHVNEQGPLVGAWFRPTDKLRINVEAEATTLIGCQATCANADQIFITRISPRQKQNYRGRVSYKPVRWADFSSSVNWWETRNGEVDTKYAQHYRNAGFVLTLFPNDRVNLDLSYNYSDSLQDAYVCYNGTYLAPGATLNACPTYDPTNAGTIANNPNPNWIYSSYSNNTHYFSGTVLLKPVKKLAANLGYGLIKTDGSATILNTLQPLGPLQFTYHQPLGSLSYEVIKDWSLNAYWNYDQYKEGSFAGPTLPRNFHDNRAVLAVKYAF